MMMHQMMKQLSLNTMPKPKIFEFDLDTGKKQFKTWVYSETGLDIEERFTPFKVTNIKEVKEPVSKTTSEKLQDELEPIT